MDMPYGVIIQLCTQIITVFQLCLIFQDIEYFQIVLPYPILSYFLESLIMQQDGSVSLFQHLFLPFSLLGRIPVCEVHCTFEVCTDIPLQLAMVY